MKTATLQTIDDYIAGFPGEVQAVLQQVRTTVHEAAPEATEKISYQMPTFALHGNLIHFAAWKYHIGFYPGASGIAQFSRELTAYEGAKGSVQFPLDRPLPLNLITRIVKFRARENLVKAELKKRHK